MKNKVFKQRLEEWEYQVRDTGKEYLIANKNGNLMATVSKKVRKQINTDFDAWDKLSDENKDMLFNLFIHFTSTPPEDREEEKKFYAKHKYLVGTEYRDANYLNFGKYDDDKLWLGFKDKRLTVQTQFSLKEIEDIKKEFDIDLKDFELVEVED